MVQIRLVLSLFFFLNTFSNKSYTQNNLPSQFAIKKKVKLSVLYLNSENFEKSLSTARLSLHDASIIKNDCLIAESYNVIAANFDKLSEIDKAIFFYKKGLFYANKTPNDTIKNYINNNLGNVYCFEKKEYEIGIKFYKKSLEYSKKYADSSQIVFTKLNIAWAYFDIGQFENGLPYLEFINKYHPKFGNESTIVVLNMINGMYNSHKGDYAKAESYFLKAIKLGSESGENEDLSYSHQEYSKFLFKKGDYKQAYSNLVTYNKLTEEIYNKEKLKKANVAGINLQLDEYKRTIDKFETEKELQFQSLKKTQIIVILFIIVMLILLLLIYFLYINNIFKKKIYQDLTRVNEELLTAKDQAVEASLAKTQFVSTISHELRTPLYGVIGITDMLLDEHKELANSTHLSSLKFSARYLLSLVNDILQINIIEESKIVLEHQTFNVSDEMNMVINSLSFISQRNNNKIIAKIDPSIPEFIIGDKLRLVQILMNLVCNALKFTKNGEVIVCANLVKVEGKLLYIEFKISDNGTGIALEDQDKIFEKFVQVGRKENDYQGTGLGLAIVKKLLDIFDSKIAIESQLGVGTTFFFTIAFEYEPHQTIENVSKTKVDLNSSMFFRVLVVEDNKINQAVTKSIMKNNNCSCSIVDDGFQALDNLNKETFDVILMDINMPLINGFETTRLIRSSGIQTPIIALTAFSKEEIAKDVFDAGMNDIIVKPFEPKLLFKVINNQINKARNAIVN